MRSPIPPKPKESMVDYVHRVGEVGGLRLDIDFTADHYGVDAGLVKAAAIASETFNNRFAFGQWQDRRKRDRSSYGADHWLRRKYALSDVELRQIVRHFEAGRSDGLSEVVPFRELAKRLLTPAHSEMLQNWDRRQG